MQYKSYKAHYIQPLDTDQLVSMPELLIRQLPAGVLFEEDRASAPASRLLPLAWLRSVLPHPLTLDNQLTSPPHQTSWNATA